MAKAKEGEFSLETPVGIFDVVSISKDLEELEILSILKNDCLKDGKFPEPKPGKICLNSICAFIIYCTSICEILDMNTDNKTTH